MRSPALGAALSTGERDDFEPKTIFITGSSSGLGRAVAELAQSEQPQPVAANTALADYVRTLPGKPPATDDGADAPADALPKSDQLSVKRHSDALCQSPTWKGNTEPLPHYRKKTIRLIQFEVYMAWG